MTNPAENQPEQSHAEPFNAAAHMSEEEFALFERSKAEMKLATERRSREQLAEDEFRRFQRDIMRKLGVLIHPATVAVATETGETLVKAAMKFTSQK